MFRFELQAQCPATGARAGLLHTAHGVVETPVFMPVGTQATVKGLPQRDLAGDLDARIILANTYHLYLRPGHEGTYLDVNEEHLRLTGHTREQLLAGGWHA